MVGGESNRDQCATVVSTDSAEIRAEVGFDILGYPLDVVFGGEYDVD